LVSESDNRDGISVDSLISAAARALAAGDPLSALKRIALREDAAALALRGIAMAQLGERVRARTLLRSAARAFGPNEPVARARCVVAEAETALASRDLVWPGKALESARAHLEKHGDFANAAYARYLQARRLLLIGSIADAEHLLATVESNRFPPAWRAVHQLVLAGIEMRRLRVRAAREALARATDAAVEARIPALMAEVEGALRGLNAPAARATSRTGSHLLSFDEIETLLASKVFIVDACRREIRQAGRRVSLSGRPVLFVLARALAEAWPHPVPRDVLIARAFRSRFADESYRVRLRVEVARLRRVLRPLADLRADGAGFLLLPRTGQAVVVLALPTEEEGAAVLALLADGESWSTSALALASGSSQRTVQRTLESLAAAHKVHALGRGRARRWISSHLSGFATGLLLPSVLPID
jgi:hypothetical protein